MVWRAHVENAHRNKSSKGSPLQRYSSGSGWAGFIIFSIKIQTMLNLQFQIPFKSNLLSVPLQAPAGALLVEVEGW